MSLRVFPEFLRRMRVATTFHGMRGYTRPRLGQDPPFGYLHGRRRPVRPRAVAITRLVGLSWPGLFTFGIGFLFHLADIHWGMSGKVPFGFFRIIMVALCMVLAARAFGAVDMQWVRHGATVLNLAYPLFLVFLALSGA